MGSMNEAEAFLAHKFTHIVIGGGTAGLVVASRLSEDLSITVGFLEAGPAAPDEPRINVPGRLGETLFTEYDWQFETTPQPGLGGRIVPWNRGKVLGGSSAMNFMMWCRGNKGDYDTWEQLGNKGWGWDGILYVNPSVFTILAVISPRDSISSRSRYQVLIFPLEIISVGLAGLTRQFFHLLNFR